MEKIYFEKEVLEALNLPSIPAKEWDGETAFDNGVAVVKLYTGDYAYAVARFDPLKDKTPEIKRVFCYEQFTKIEKVFVVPSYMDTNIEDADLDEQSKKKAEEIINEAAEVENQGIEVETPQQPDNEYCFDHIHNDEEALAFIEAWNKQNKIKGGLPKKHDTIVTKLAAIWAEQNKASNN